tara:strand:- start:484 stop:804 length:321 start_codon:yes stop_codon:yes gene_type:complete
MALEIDYEHELGFTKTDVYAKIARISLDNMKTITVEDEAEDDTITIEYSVKYYKDQQSRSDGEHPFGGDGFSMTLDDANTKTQYNILKQCYLHLKEQDGFTDATDV